MSDQADIERAKKVTAMLEGKPRWKYGFRWCEGSNVKCQSTRCMEDDVCGHVLEGYTIHDASNAYYINKTLKNW